MLTLLQDNLIPCCKNPPDQVLILKRCIIIGTQPFKPGSYL